MLASGASWIIELEKAVDKIGDQDAPRFHELFNSQDVSIEIYAPRDRDRQEPHDRDELYFVGQGTAWFWDGKHRAPCAPGTAIFVPAGQPHRFEEFSDDFATWVVFFGKKNPR